LEIFIGLIGLNRFEKTGNGKSHFDTDLIITHFKERKLLECGFAKIRKVVI